MKYLQLLALMVLAISASASAANISQKATDVAKQFLTQKAGLRSLPQGELTMAVMQTTPDKAVKLKKGKAAQADYYAYNVPNGGFVLMAPLTDGEIKVVGYSIDSNFEFDNAPDALVAWLTSYKEAVATRGNTYPHPTVKPVTPILTTSGGKVTPTTACAQNTTAIRCLPAAQLWQWRKSCITTSQPLRARANWNTSTRAWATRS